MKYLLAILIVFGVYWYWTGSDIKNTYTATPGATLTNAEKVYYMQVFDYTMSNIEDGAEFEWESHNGKGELVPTNTYTSKSSSTCRQYKEAFEIGAQPGANQGIACKREGADGWCRINGNNPQTCALENPGNDIILGNIGVGDIHVADIKIGGAKIDTDIDAPTPGGIGHVGGPDVEPPQAPDRPGWLPKFEERKEGQTSADWLIQ